MVVSVIVVGLVAHEGLPQTYLSMQIHPSCSNRTLYMFPFFPFHPFSLLLLHLFSYFIVHHTCTHCKCVCSNDRDKKLECVIFNRAGEKKVAKAQLRYKSLRRGGQRRIRSRSRDTLLFKCSSNGGVFLCGFILVFCG